MSTLFTLDFVHINLFNSSLSFELDLVQAVFKNYLYTCQNHNSFFHVEFEFDFLGSLTWIYLYSIRLLSLAKCDFL